MSGHDSEYIRSKAVIYGCDPGKKITQYQQEMNKAAIELALQDPSLRLSKQKLIAGARSKVNQVYNFKKGKSRSKESQSSTGSTPKRPKTTETLRLKHIGEIEEDVRDLCDQLEFKRKRQEQAEMSRNYKVCDQLTEEMSSLKKRKRECEEELRLWKRKQQQGRWYKRSKKRLSTSESEGDARQQRTRSLSTTPSPSTQSSRATSPVSLSSTPFSPAEFEPTAVREEPCTSSGNSCSISPKDVLSAQLITESPLPHSLPDNALGSTSPHFVDLTGTPDFHDVRDVHHQSCHSPVDLDLSCQLGSQSALDVTTPIEPNSPTLSPNDALQPTDQCSEELTDLSAPTLPTSTLSLTSTTSGSANTLPSKDSADIALSPTVPSPATPASGQASTASSQA